MASFMKEFEHLRIPLEDIKSATNNFDETHVIGHGGFGKVYKGELLLSEGLTMVALKRLHRRFGQSDPEFWKEIMMLSRYRHENVISLLGFCDESGEKILAYEYASYGSLDKHLSSSHLSWNQRLRICIGVARALCFLHDSKETNQILIHRNIKSSNILLDHNWNAKVGGFSLSGMFPANQSFHPAELVGTRGYVDPLYMETDTVTKESDVYSFGVVLFEVLCGRLCYEGSSGQFQHHVPLWKKSYEENKLEEIILRDMQSEISPDCLERFSKVAYQCLHKDREERPPMALILTELEIALELQMGKLYSKFPPQQIPLPLIVTATSNFAAKNLIKEDSFGKDYKGQMLQSGQLTDIVARRLDCIYGQEIFFGAISIHSSLKHKNIVSFIGFCNENGEKILIYEHPARGRLDQYDVIHCNINSSKKILDKDWEAKLSGFELSTKYPESWKHRLIFSHHFDNSGNPVYLKNATVTPKYDVYSFGVVLFEVLCGRKATIGDSGVEEGKLDEIILEGLRKQMDKESLTIFSKIAYNCLKEYVQRPTIDQVVRDLEEALEHQRDKDLSSNPLKSKNLECFRICFSDIKLATLSFNEDNCVGEGGYGKVYKAYLEHLDIEKFSPEMEGKNKNELPKRSSKVAIKRITDIQEGKEGFLAEIKLLTSCKHQNIVSLLGFSSEDHEMILVYEFLDKGSLDDHLTKKKINLTWNQRLQICLNIAEGLKYLHTSMEGKPEIIHRDIKSGNVLLDEKGNAKISDFGLSKFHPAKQLASIIQSKGYVGTVVYLDPEYLTTGKYKKETDIYSFGVVLFEILSGTLAYDPVYLAENHRGLSLIARRRFNEGTLKELIDPTMMVEDNEQRFTLNRGPNQDSFNAFTKIAYQCLAETQAKRPTMEVIIEELRNAQNFQGKTMVLYKVRRNDIVQATERIGFDIHGMVYKAELDQFESESSSSIEEKNKREEAVKKRITVAIKVKRIFSREDEQGEQGFFEELEMCISYKHPNISSLLGFCDEGREMIFVYEHACNGSTLDDYLGSNDDKTVLTWAQRLRKCMEIARGLNHLHTKMGSKQSIIHGDIRSANIFFGKNFEAKITYFGHSNLHPANQEANTKVYLDPEYEITGKLGTKSDIYSFGVVLFEILCGKLAYDRIYNGSDKGLAPIARQCYNNGTIKEMIDPKLIVETDEDVSTANKGPNQDSLDTFLKVAYQCLGETQTKRPTMETVITELQNALKFQEFKSEEKSYVQAS